MDDEGTRFSYSSRSIIIAAASSSIGVCLIFFYLAFGRRNPISLQASLFVVWALSCCLSYFSAGGLFKYSKGIWQNYIPAWLAVSFLGSIVCVVLTEVIYYFHTLELIKNYRENTSVFSSDPIPILPTFEQFVMDFLVGALILFAVSGLVSSVSSFVANLLPKKKEDEPNTLLEL